MDGADGLFIGLGFFFPGEPYKARKSKRERKGEQKGRAYHDFSRISM